jgi:hypothetical protein
MFELAGQISLAFSRKGCASLVRISINTMAVCLGEDALGEELCWDCSYSLALRAVRLLLSPFILAEEWVMPHQLID